MFLVMVDMSLNRTCFIYMYMYFELGGQVPFVEDNLHAIPCSQVPVYELEGGQVGHAFCDLNAKVHQLFHRRTL